MPSPRIEVYGRDLDGEVVVEDLVEDGVEDVMDEDNVRVFHTPAGEFTVRLIDLCERALPLLVTVHGGNAQERSALVADIRAALPCSDQ